MVNRRQILLGTVATGISANLNSLAAADGQVGDRIDEIARAEFETSKAPGAAIVVTRGAGPIHIGTYGLARRADGSKSAITEDTLFRIGSVTKMFVSAAALSLVDKRSVVLDAPAGNLLPEIAGTRIKRSVTLRLALNHSSGLMELLTDDGPGDERQLARQVLAYTDAMQILPAGNFFSYSAPGYNLAGLLLERAAQRPFADALSELVTEPLGMKRSGFRPTKIRTGNYTEGHGIDERGTVFDQPYVNNPGDWPDGFFATNLVEMTRFLRTLLRRGKLDGKQVVPTSVVDGLLSAQVQLPQRCQPFGKGFSRGLTYGFGWFHQMYRGVPVLHHGGWITGFGAMAVLVPDHDLAVFATSSLDNFHLPDTVRAVLDALLPVDPPEKVSLRASPVQTSVARQLVGRYRNKGWADFSIEARGADLFRVNHEPIGKAGTAARIFSLGEEHLQAVPADGAPSSELLVLRDQKGAVTALLDSVFAVPRI